jgi:hypothetical protein
LEWKSIVLQQSGSLLYDPTSKEISGILWEYIDQEEVKKEFRHGCVVCFSASSTLEMYLMAVLGGGDTEWVACALGKEYMTGAHCNHCRGSKNNFHLGRRRELWTLALLVAMARTF